VILLVIVGWPHRPITPQFSRISTGLIIAQPTQMSSPRHSISSLTYNPTEATIGHETNGRWAHSRFISGRP